MFADVQGYVQLRQVGGARRGGRRCVWRALTSLAHLHAPAPPLRSPSTARTGPRLAASTLACPTGSPASAPIPSECALLLPPRRCVTAGTLRAAAAVVGGPRLSVRSAFAPGGGTR